MKNIKAQCTQWVSDGGVKQKRWEITHKDGLTLGTIYPTDYGLHSTKQPNARFSVFLGNSYRQRYFATFKEGLNWIVRYHKNIIPLSRLNEFINNI